MRSSPSRRAAPQGAVPGPQISGGQGHRQPGVPLPRNFRPIAAHRQQQSAVHPHRMVGDQPEPQIRRRPQQRLQQLCRTLQRWRGQQAPDLPRQRAVQPPWRHHQHRLAGHRVPEGIPRVAKGGEGRLPAAEAHPGRHQLPPDALSGRRPEHHRQHQIGRGGGNQQDPGVHVRVEHAVHHRHAATGQQAQSQHTTRQGAGDGEEQQRQPQQLLLPAVGRQRQQHPRRQLHRRGGKKAQSRQEHRHGIGAPQQPRQQIPAPPEGDPRQPAHGERKQIVHQRIQHEHAVHIHHGQVRRPLSVPRNIL